MIRPTLNFPIKTLRHSRVPLCVAVVAIGCRPPLGAETATRSETGHEEIPLYAAPAPGSDHWILSESETQFAQAKILRNVVHSRLTVFEPPPEKALGTAVIVAPGGGMMYLSIEDEGYGVARWLAARGFTAFVLKYRTLQMTEADPEFRAATIKVLSRFFAQTTQPGGVIDSPVAAHTPVAVADGVQAIHVVRSLAAKFGYSPDRIVMVGFSAGGRIAIGAALSPNPEDRPNYTGLIYAGVFEAAPSAPVPIPQGAPPVFMASAANDPLRMWQLPLYEQLIKASVPVELHIYEKGGHGFGIRPQQKTSDHWIDECYWWLESHGLTTKPGAPAAG